MKNLTKNWIFCSLKLTFFLILFTFFLIILCSKVFNILNLPGCIILFFLCITISLVFVFFGRVFISKVFKKINKIDEILYIISKSILYNDNESYNFNIEIDNEIDNLIEKIGEIAFKIKASEHLKNDFISSISHELRTPLTAIKGWAETMKVGNVIDLSTLRRGLEVIIKETERLSGIVDELIDFSGFESGRIIMNMEKIDLSAEINEAVFMFKDRASCDNKTLLCDAPESISCIWGDRARLRQVFVNIIDNSIKYTEENGEILVILAEKDNKIIIEITDNGCGVPKQCLSKIKQKFYKADVTHRGSGIGLAIANEIIIAHNGSLEINSVETQGTTVLISIPIFKEE
ncbi:MAG: HAMP domain-containing protein [Candidatus Improbicoccus devescovinae]|nr:MAG: HAMP domain-containing protein [Candidatus Improbicoccus devescovinae]